MSTVSGLVEKDFPCPECGLPLGGNGVVYGCPNMHCFAETNPIKRLPRSMLIAILTKRIAKIETTKLGGFIPLIESPGEAHWEGLTVEEIILSPDHPWGTSLYMQALPLYYDLLLYRTLLEIVEESQGAHPQRVDDKEGS